MKTCKYCGGEILDTAKKCKHCGEWVENTLTKAEEENQTQYCPYCGETILATAIKCKHCGEKLKEKNINFNFISTGKLVFLTIITLGIYSFYYMYKVSKEINKLKIANKINFNTYFIPAIILYFINWIATDNNYNIGTLAGLPIIFFSLHVINRLRDYVSDNYNKKIQTNPVCIVLFGIFYLNFFINTLSERIENGKTK